MSKRGKLYVLALAAVFLVLVAVFARSCHQGNDPQHLDGTVIEQDELSPEEDNVETQQSRN